MTRVIRRHWPIKVGHQGDSVSHATPFLSSFDFISATLFLQVYHTSLSALIHFLHTMTATKRCTTCHSKQDDDQFFSKSGTWRVKTCLRCRTHHRNAYLVKTRPNSASVPVELLHLQQVMQQGCFMSPTVDVKQCLANALNALQIMQQPVRIDPLSTN